MAMKKLEKFFPGRQEDSKNTSPFVSPEYDNGERDSPEFTRKPRFNESADAGGGGATKKTVVVIEDDKQRKTMGKKKGNTGPVSVIITE